MKRYRFYALGVELTIKGGSLGSALALFIVFWLTCYTAFTIFWALVLWLITDHSYWACFLPGLVIALVYGTIVALLRKDSQ